MVRLPSDFKEWINKCTGQGHGLLTPRPGFHSLSLLSFASSPSVSHFLISSVADVVSPEILIYWKVFIKSCWVFLWNASYPHPFLSNTSPQPLPVPAITSHLDGPHGFTARLREAPSSSLTCLLATAVHLPQTLLFHSSVVPKPSKTPCFLGHQTQASLLSFPDP